jgi:hypothetical protein
LDASVAALVSSRLLPSLSSRWFHFAYVTPLFLLSVTQNDERAAPAGRYKVA